MPEPTVPAMLLFVALTVLVTIGGTDPLGHPWWFYALAGGWAVLLVVGLERNWWEAVVDRPLYCQDCYHDWVEKRGRPGRMTRSVVPERRGRARRGRVGRRSRAA